MIDLVEKIKDFKMSRRSFIGWTSAIAATAAIPVGRGLVAKAEAKLAQKKLVEKVFGKQLLAGITVAAAV